jgi:glycerophosphoryl diester phosphodiesterase
MSPRGSRRAAAGLVLALAALAAGAPIPALATADSFNLEGHRGARGLRPENTLAAFGKALTLGVTTLELDTGVTRDGVVVVSHERRISPLECVDTAPATPGDPAYPYVGKLVKDLTLRQIRTLDCGTRRPANPATDPYVGAQEAVPGTHMPTLAQVFQLTERYGAGGVRFDIETKIDPTTPGDTIGPAAFAKKVTRVIKRYRMTQRSDLQSFDWRTLVAARSLLPSLRRVALAQASTIFPGTKWSAGLPIGAKPFDGALAKVVRKGLKASALSVNYPDITDGLIAAAHRQGLKLIPWTVDDPAIMASLIDRGVDGLITDYPDRARTVGGQGHRSARGV